VRKQSVLGLLLVLVVSAGSACGASPGAGSKQAESVASADSGEPSASASPTDLTSASPSDPTSPMSSPMSSPTTAASPSAAPERPVRPTPSEKVPKLETPTIAPRQYGPVLGADISWPQCPKGMGIPLKRSAGSPMPIDAARYVILGLTNGPGFYPNPCLALQTEWVRSRGLMAAAYSVISYPEDRHFAAYRDKGPFDSSTRRGALGNVGYQQARFNLATMRKAGLQSPIIWLDVEPVPDYDWPPDLAANAAVVRGAARGYTEAGFAIGAYSTQALWQRVVGDLRLGIPEWRAAGQTSREEALRRCGLDRMFQGGPAILSQWLEDGRDQNVTCGSVSSQMARWFHQY
jgi:hypothetical protein